MRVALIGLPLAGKSTIFNVLTRGQAGTVTGGGRGGQTQIAVVEVPDRRMDALVAMFQPRKISPASVEFVDGVGVATEGRGNFGAQFLTDVRASDALVHVVRAYENSAVPVERPVDVVRDAKELEYELILADLALVETRLERLAQQQKGKPKSGAVPGAVEQEVLERFRAHLERELPASAMELSAQDREAIQHLSFLSSKPTVIVANINEADLAAEASGPWQELRAHGERTGTPVLAMCGEVEMEVAQLPAEEEQSFLEAMGIEESGRYRLIRTVFELLGLISFFTVGEDEVKAWTIHRGDNAVTAAGKIHSDLARGFIRAEVVPYDALAAAGSVKAARDAGHYRLEQKPYIVRDGDILNIRFSV